MKDAMTTDAPGEGGWMLAGVLTDLEGAVLTTLPGEEGLAGKIELHEALRHAANDEPGKVFP